MKQMRITYLLMTVVAVLAASCSSHDDDGVPVQTVTMPIKLSIPAEGFGDPTRVTEAGDPGTFELFELPRYLYIFLESKYIDANNNEEKTIIYKEINLGDQKNNPMWVKVKDDLTPDSLYTYTGNLSIDLPLQRTSGKVYVAASVQRLANTESNKKEYLYFKNGDNYESSLNGATANSSTNIPVETKFAMETNKQLHNLYSTPYNLANTNGEYYGTLKDYASKVPSINLKLYHVAAKIDVSWSVDESIQNNVKLVAFQARDLQEYDAYLFKPLQKTYNESSSNLFGKEEGYNVWLINTATLSGSNYVFGEDVIGLQWYGRGYFYALLGKATDNNYYIKMLVQNQMKYESGNTKGHYFLIEILKDKVKGTKNIGIDGEPVFTPWVRATVRVKSDFVYNKESDVPIPPSSTSTNAIESQSQIIE